MLLSFHIVEFHTKCHPGRTGVHYWRKDQCAARHICLIFSVVLFLSSTSKSRFRLLLCAKRMSRLFLLKVVTAAADVTIYHLALTQMWHDLIKFLPWDFIALIIFCNIYRILWWIVLNLSYYPINNMTEQ